MPRFWQYWKREGLYNRLMLVFSGSSNQSLARKLAKRLGTRLGKLELSRFADDEARVWVKEKKPGREAIIVQALSYPSDHHLLEFCLIGDALKRLGVKAITAVIPWLAYSRQDKVFRRGEPLSVELVVKMLELVPLRRVISFDLHNPKTAELFKVKAVNLSARPALVEYFKNKADEQTVLVAPDAGAVGSSRLAAKELGIKLVVIDKHRDLSSNQVTIKGMKGEVKGKRVIVLDDMIAGGSTLIKVSRWLKQEGAKQVMAGVTHDLQIPGVQKKLEKSLIDELVVTDTIESRFTSKKIKIITVVELIVNQLQSKKVG